MTQAHFLLGTEPRVRGRLVMPNLVPGLKQEEERVRLAMASSAVQTVGAPVC